MCPAVVSRAASGVAVSVPSSRTPHACSARSPAWRPKRSLIASRARAGVITPTTLDGGQLLVQRDRVGEQVADLVDAAEDLLGVEGQQAGVARLVAFADLVPGHRRRDRGAILRAHGV